MAPLRELSPQKRSGMARVLKGSHSFTCTPTRSSAIGMSHMPIVSLSVPVVICTPAGHGYAQWRRSQVKSGG